MNFKIYILVSLLLINCIVAAQQTQNKLPTSQKGNSLNFDGKDDQIRAPYSPLLNINNGTLEATIKIVDSTNFEWHPIISKQLAYQITLFGYRLGTYDWKERKLYCYGPSLNDNKWHHVAFVFQEGVINGSQLYLDGQPVGLPFTYHIFNQTAQIDIGGNNFWDQFFNGFIDEVRIWSRPLLKAEIQQNATTEVSKYSKNLILYYKFNDGIAGGNNSSMLKVNDETANKMDGYLFNFTLIGSVSNYTSETVIKPYNDNRLVSFIIDQRWILFWSLIAFIGAFIFYRLRTKYLVNQNKKLEKVIAKRTKQLDELLIEKDVLIQEIHHRVKNNLQFMLSIIDMQMMLNKNKDDNALQDVSRRLTAMALVNELLYRQDDVEKISTKVYFNVFVENIKKMVENKASHINCNIEDIIFTVSQCTSIGMIMSELISNSLKYAFVNQENQIIDIQLKRINGENEIELVYADNGIGFDENNPSQGLGSTLINVFCKQIKGVYQYKNGNGVLFMLKFKI